MFDKMKHYLLVSWWADAPALDMEMARGMNVAKMKCFLSVKLKKAISQALQRHGEKSHARKVWMTPTRAWKLSLDSLLLKRVCAMVSCFSEAPHLEVVFVELRAQLDWTQLRVGLLQLAMRLPCAPGTVFAIRSFAFLGRRWGC